MKILQIFNRYIYEGGEENSVDRIFQVLGEVHDVRQILFDSKDWQREQGLLSDIKQAARMVHNPQSIQIVKEAISQFSPDVILIHNLFPVGSASLLRFLTKQKIPIVYYVHNFRPFSVNGYLWANNKIQRGGLSLNYLPEIWHGSWQESRLKTFWYANILWSLHLAGAWRRITHWIAISQFMKDSFSQAGIPKDRLTVLRHSWQIGTDRLERTEFSPSAPFVYLGRLSEQKGLKILMKAWEKFVAEEPKAKLVICGEGPLTAEIKTFASNHPSVNFEGFVKGEEKDDLLRSARCLLAPSVWYEPLGLVVYDGYEYSLPVIAAASGGLSEIVDEARTGYLVPSGDSDRLAAAMQRLVKLPDGGVQIGHQGREWLENNTSDERWRSRIHKVFEGLPRKNDRSI